LRPDDTHGGETSGEPLIAKWPVTKKGRKLLIELLGFKWDKYNALHTPHMVWKTQLGQNVTCAGCKQLITLKNMGAMLKVHNTVQFSCKDYMCKIELEYKMFDAEENNGS
jgi:hypothetical protein